MSKKSKDNQVPAPGEDQPVIETEETTTIIMQQETADDGQVKTTIVAQNVLKTRH